MLPSKSDCLLAKELFRVQLTLSNMLSKCPLIAGGLLNVEIVREMWPAVFSYVSRQRGVSGGSGSYNLQ